MAVLASLAAWLALAVRDELTGPAALLGAAGCLALAVAAVWRRAAAAASLGLALVGGEYALLVAVDAEGLDARAPLVAAGLLAAGELAAWSAALQVPIPDEAGAWWRRLAIVLLEATAAYGVTAGVLAVADAGDGGLVLEALGVAALAAGSLLVARLASR